MPNLTITLPKPIPIPVAAGPAKGAFPAPTWSPVLSDSGFWWNNGMAYAQCDSVLVRLRRNRTMSLGRHYDHQNLVLQELQGGLWHTTSSDRYDRILRCGEILAEPDIPDSERWGGTSFVRKLGSVSLFDFHQFDPDAYTAKYPISSWWEFVPYSRTSGRSVCIEIDRKKIDSRFISANDLVEQWESTGSYRHRIMPRLEAACIGSVPVGAFKRAFSVGKDDDRIRPLTASR